GKELWFHQAPAGEEDADFRPQVYDGKPVLTFWEGTGLGGLSSGSDYIYNDHYKQIAVVNAGNGYSADGHEFLITPSNTALVLSYATATANLTSINGPADQTVIDGIVQEINIKTGKVLFQWNSADHVPYNESEQPLPATASTPWDWFHVNAVKVASDGDLLIDARDTWTTYKVSLRTGNIIWQLGGKDSSFTLKAAPGQTLDQADELFAWQHDPQQVGPNLYTFFDNESSGTPELAYSRVDVVRINQRTKTATLVKTYGQPEGLVAASQGNAQTMASGDLFVGWGILPYISEFSPSGNLLFNAEFPAGVNTYRAYRLPWPQRPAWPGHHGKKHHH
ncbi:MAG TPA: arylsulfotransferase family protein, partial [Streptosporangiaceae bacterium]|nr:arylsulfotransferase family protein [Streptosporangiaceae bacterium]